MRQEYSLDSRHEIWLHWAKRDASVRSCSWDLGLLQGRPRTEVGGVRCARLVLEANLVNASCRFFS